MEGASRLHISYPHHVMDFLHCGTESFQIPGRRLGSDDVSHHNLGPPEVNISRIKTSSKLHRWVLGVEVLPGLGTGGRFLKRIAKVSPVPKASSATVCGHTSHGHLGMFTR